MNQTAPERFEPSPLQSLDSVHGRGVPSKTWNPAVQSMQSVVCTCARAVAQYSCQNKCLSTQLYSLIPIKINSQILSRSSCFGRVMIYIRITNTVSLNIGLFWLLSMYMGLVIKIGLTSVTIELYVSVSYLHVLEE